MAKEPFNKALIYDDNCPLCQAYSSAFVRSGFLSKENRISFSQIGSFTPPAGNKFSTIDWQKARHEIPLIDLENGEVLYGVDALVDVLSQKINFIRKVMVLRLPKAFLVTLYKFISYNRKVIAANYKPIQGSFDCSPQYSFFWRYMLIIITWSLSLLFTTLVAGTLNESVKSIDAYVVFLVLLFMPFPLVIYKSKKFMADLYAHSGIIYIITSFLLFLVVFFKNIFHLPDLLFYVLFGGVEYVLIRQVVQRIRFLKLK